METASRQRTGAEIAGRGRAPLVRRHGAGLWDLPGGGAEAGESVLDAAQRELKEETDLDVIDVTLLGVFSGSAHQHLYPGGHVLDWVTALYPAHGFAGTPAAGDDAAELYWWPVAGLPRAVSPATAAYFAALHARTLSTESGAMP